jgi:ABC-2 type transport system permease protein
MSAVRTLVAKEWSEIRRNRLVLSVVLFMPLLITAIPVVMLAVIARVGINQSDYDQLGPLLDNPMFAGMSPLEAMQAVLASNMLVLFLIMPVMVPVTIATNSIVGEKLTRSLEPLLATPISTTELVVGKGVAAAAPGIATVWVSYAVFLAGARLFSVSERVFLLFVNPMWLVALLVLAPLLTVMAVCAGIIVSSRATDPGGAQQLGSLVVLPLMLLLVGALTGVIQLSGAVFWIAALVVALVDVALLRLAVSLFQRETILTRWK